MITLNWELGEEGVLLAGQLQWFVAALHGLWYCANGEKPEIVLHQNCFDKAKHLGCVWNL